MSSSATSPRTWSSPTPISTRRSTATPRRSSTRLVAELRADRDLKVEAQHLKHVFAANAETLLHGDLHTGSVMVTDGEHAGSSIRNSPSTARWPSTSACCSPISGWPTSSQPGHEHGTGDRAAMRDYLLAVASDIWSVFRDEFSASLAHRAHRHPLSSRSLFEDQGDMLAAEQALDRACSRRSGPTAGLLPASRCTAASSASPTTPISRRSPTPTCRAACEATALRLGRHLVRQPPPASTASTRSTRSPRRIEKEHVA